MVVILKPRISNLKANEFIKKSGFAAIRFFSGIWLL